MLCDFGNIREEKTGSGLLRCAKLLLFCSCVAEPEDEKDAEHYENGGQERPHAQLLSRYEITQREGHQGVHVGVAGMRATSQTYAVKAISEPPTSSWGGSLRSRR